MEFFGNHHPEVVTITKMGHRGVFYTGAVLTRRTGGWRRSRFRPTMEALGSNKMECNCELDQ
jgi:hypothetical protein